MPSARTPTTTRRTLAKRPRRLRFDWIASHSFDAQTRVAERDDHVVVAMDMPKRRIARRHSDIPDAHKFIFKFWMMTRLAFDLDW